MFLHQMKGLFYVSLSQLKSIQARSADYLELHRFLLRFTHLATMLTLIIGYQTVRFAAYILYCIMLLALKETDFSPSFTQSCQETDFSKHLRKRWVSLPR